MSAKDRYFELKSKMSELETLIKKEYKEAFAEVCKEFFVQYPNVHSLKWNQYTPYFNDGDPCYFNVNQVYVKFKTEDTGSIINFKNDEDDDEDEGGDGYLGWSRDKSIESIIDKADEVINQFDNDELAEMFGDGVTVWVYPDRVDTEECSHD